MGKYLDIFRGAEQSPVGYDKNDVNDRTYTRACTGAAVHNPQYDFGRICRFGRSLNELERRCPDRVDIGDWQQAVEDARRFLARWGEQAEALGWTAGELFGLQRVPEGPAANYRRLSRYDETGLIWLLRGRPVVALTETTAAIQGATAAVTYRKLNKPACGPLGDSLDDFGSSRGLGHPRSLRSANSPAEDNC
jgi:hypothetical protein